MAGGAEVGGVQKRRCGNEGRGSGRVVNPEVMTCPALSFRASRNSGTIPRGIDYRLRTRSLLLVWIMRTLELRIGLVPRASLAEFVEPTIADRGTHNALRYGSRPCWTRFSLFALLRGASQVSVKLSPGYRNRTIASQRCSRRETDTAHQVLQARVASEWV